MLSDKVRLFGDPVEYSPPGSSVHGIFQKEYWSGLPFPPAGDLPYPGIEPSLLHLLHWWPDSLPTTPPGKPHFLSWEDTTHKLGN